MKLAAAALQAQVVTGIGRDNWIEMQLVQTLMRHSRTTLHAASVVMVLMALTLSRNADFLELGLWVLAIVAVNAYRYRLLGIYRHQLQNVSGGPLRAFLRRYSWTWLAAGLAWGALLQVCFLKTPVYQQFLCLFLLVGMAGFAVGTFSSCLQCFNGYVDGLGISVMGVMVWQLFVRHGELAGFNSYSLVFMALFYWAVIRIAGRHFHDVQRANLELQFDNAELIISLTEKTRASQEAVEITNRFISSAAHDLRQPVHALDLYASWLEAEPQFVTQIVPKIVRSTRAITELFDSLFDLAGLNSDPLRVKWEHVDISTLLQDLDLQYAPLVAERGIRLKTRATPFMVRTDPVLLKRLVGNLLSNAVRNTHKGGVVLALRRRQGGACIEVWDTGVGIAREHQSSVFKEFYRIPLRGTEEGFGLGLAIVSRLSEALGLPVTMSSRFGRGSVFRVELGLEKSVPAAETDRTGPPARD